MLAKVSSAWIPTTLVSAQSWNFNVKWKQDKVSEITFNTGSHDNVINPYLQIVGTFTDSWSSPYLDGYCKIEIFDDSTLIDTIQYWPRQWANHNINLIEYVPNYKTAKFKLTMHAEYTDKYYSTSGTVTAKGYVLSISYKKIKIYEEKNIGKKATVYLFGMLPDGTRRDGN